MAIATTTLIAVGGLVVAGAGAYQGMQARKEAKEAQEQGLALQRSAAGEQAKMNAEQKALNAAQVAQERRNQIRQERVRKAKILQSSENTGVDGSSGEFGSLGSLGTNLVSNLGTIAGRAASGNRSSQYAQNAANFNSQAQDAGIRAQNFMSDAATGDSLFSLGGSIFSSAGGFGTLSTAMSGAGGGGVAYNPNHINS